MNLFCTALGRAYVVRYRGTPVKEFGAAFSLLQMRRRLHSSPELIRDEQTRKLREIIQHAYSTTPYYRNLFDAAGVHPRDILTLADLGKIPTSRKGDLLEVPLEDRIAKGTNFSNCVTMSSSGSSGTSWEVLISPSEKIRKQLAHLRARLANGYHFFHTTCRFWNPRIPDPPGHWFQHLGLLRHRYPSVLDDLDTKIRILMEGNYDTIISLSSNLLVVVEAMLQRGIAPTPPKVLITFGEVLDPLQRRTIHQGFGQDPTDFYGSVEFGLVAWQCPERQGYHANADLFILELVKDGTHVGAGEEGEIVITDLAPRAMPLIRYATDDWSSSSGAACPCGITLPTLSHIIGDSRDFLLLPSGKKIAPFYVVIPLLDTPGIRSFQVTQVSRSEVVIRYTRRSDASEDPSPAILQALRPITGETMQLHVQEVENIAPPKGRKFKVVENALLRAERPT